MQKKRLERKIILALCLGIAFHAPAVYAADVTLGNQTKNETNTNSGVHGYDVTANNQTIDTTNGSITTKVDNSGWSTGADTRATAFGFLNNGHTGILLQNGTAGYFPITVTATGGNATSISTSADASAYGILAPNSTMTINSNTIIEAVAKGGSAQSASASAAGINAVNLLMTINGNTTIEATATGGRAQSAYAYANGINVQDSVMTINGNTTIEATATGGRAQSAYAAAYAAGIWGCNSNITINGNTTIQAAANGSRGTYTNAWAYSLYGRDGGEININQTTGNPYNVQLIGDVAAYGGSTINLSLNNNNSFLCGNVLTGTSGSNTINFIVANGAVWQPVYDNRNGTFLNDYAGYSKLGTYSTSVNTINKINLSNGGIIDLTWDDATRTSNRTLNIGTLSGNGGSVKINTDLAHNTGDTVAVTTASEPTTLQVAINYDPLMASGTTDSIAVTGYSPVTVTNGASNVTLVGTASETGAYYIAPTFSGTSLTNLELGASTNTKAAASAARGQAETMQTSVNHLRKRLGDLRESPETENGVWARIYNGEVTNDKYSKIESDYNGLQVGYDNSKQVKDGRMYNGVAFSYTNADNSFTRGTGNDKAYDVALYKTWLGNNGHYYDIIAKRGRLNSDYQVTDISSNHSTANYKTWTDSLSAEYGYKKQLNNGWYLEPQAELTYGHIDGVDYTTSAGMNVKQDSIDRLIGRMGMGVGKKLNNGNHIYTSLSMLHEFQGDENIKAGTLNYEQDMSGTWYEFILGTTAKLSDHSNGYVNVEKLFGGDVSSNWQVNAGCRFSF